jgi:DNA invertase Pin-like site-specific DNA recombinase
MIAAIYARVSTKDKGQDVENQLFQLREYCDRQEWKATEYIDHESAKSGNREAFQRMFQDASRRKFDVVLVWSLDRFTREGVLETFQYIQRLKRWRVQFESYTEAHFRTTGPTGELMLAVAAWIAKQERQRISDRTKAGMERAKRQGVQIGRPERIYRRDKVIELHREGRSLRDIEAELKISRMTAMRYLASVTKGSPPNNPAVSLQT